MRYRIHPRLHYQLTVGVPLAAWVLSWIAFSLVLFITSSLSDAVVHVVACAIAACLGLAVRLLVSRHCYPDPDVDELAETMTEFASASRQRVRETSGRADRTMPP